MADNPYYIKDGILIKGTFYTGQTFVDDHQYDYYLEDDVPLHAITSVGPDGEIKDIIL